MTVQLDQGMTCEIRVVKCVGKYIHRLISCILSWVDFMVFDFKEQREGRMYLMEVRGDSFMVINILFKRSPSVFLCLCMFNINISQSYFKSNKQSYVWLKGIVGFYSFLIYISLHLSIHLTVFTYQGSTAVGSNGFFSKASSSIYILMYVFESIQDNHKRATKATKGTKKEFLPKSDKTMRQRCSQWWGEFWRDQW